MIGDVKVSDVWELEVEYEEGFSMEISSAKTLSVVISNFRIVGKLFLKIEDTEDISISFNGMPFITFTIKPTFLGKDINISMFKKTLLQSIHNSLETYCIYPEWMHIGFVFLSFNWIFKSHFS